VGFGTQGSDFLFNNLGAVAVSDTVAQRTICADRIEREAKPLIVQHGS
jgi:hypothetical protein